MSDACLGLSALPVQQNSRPPRDRAGAARPKGSCIWGAHVCMSCEELRMDMGVNLCVSALKFNINCSDENQSCWILLNFLLRKKNSSPFLLQLENPMQSHYNMRRKNPQAPANFRCEINCKKKKGTEAVQQGCGLDPQPSHTEIIDCSGQWEKTPTISSLKTETNWTSMLTSSLASGGI